MSVSNQFVFYICACLQLWCAAGVDLTGWRASSQEVASTKASSGVSNPLQAEEEKNGKKTNHTSPEKKKVGPLRTLNLFCYTEHIYKGSINA